MQQASDQVAATRKLRIVHVISAPAAGGAEVYVKDLALAMAARGHFVAIAFLNHAHEVGRQRSYEEIFLEELSSAGVKVGFIGYKARRNPLFGWIRMRQLLREWNPDVVHSHLFYGLLFSAFSAAPVIYTHHNIKERFGAWVYRMLFDRVVAAYVGICAACVKVLRSASSRPVVRIDNGVSSARVRRRPEALRGSAAVRLFSAGRLIEQKNYSLLLEAVAGLEDLDFSLEIAGEGPLRSALEREVEQRNLSHRVTLLGNVSNIPERLSESDIFVMSSASEGLPIALLEATLTGLPVVVTNVGGCAEVVHTVGNGLVVDALDAKDLAVALRRMIESEIQRSFFSHNALKYSKHYELETSIALHLSLYANVADT